MSAGSYYKSSIRIQNVKEHLRLGKSTALYNYGSNVH